MKIKKRNGGEVAFNPTKILSRIKKATKGLKVNSDEIFIKGITSLPNEGTVTTKEIDKLLAEICASYTGTHYDYSKMAANIAISSYHKDTNPSFSETMKTLNKDGIINDTFMEKLNKYGCDKVDDVIDHERDFRFDYFAWRSLNEMYLTKTSEGVHVERPQHMYMRVSIWVTNSFEEAVEYYESLSNQLISPATPIMINSGTKIPQLASCVLHYNNEDSRDGLLDSLRDISVYSADAAGIGLCMSNIRSKESRISTSGGFSGGLLKYLKIVNESLRFFNQQGRRPGSAAIYIEPWHKDVVDLLDIKKNTGAEELRARDLFTSLWIPDNFMEAVQNDSDWYLFCPNDIIKAGLKPLQECYGEEYEKIYNKAVEMGIGKKVKAQDIWSKVIESQVETGVPYLCSKDNANKKTNHQNLGVIKQSNLCNEIYQFTDEETTAICTLSSTVIKNYVKEKTFDFELLNTEVRKIVRALNRVIDINAYSTDKGRKGGLEQRAIAIGVQGLADTFFLMDYTFTSEEAKNLNKRIFETIYFAAVTESNELCKSGEYKPYKHFKGSPMSKSNFQFDMWGIDQSDLMWDWEGLKESVREHGICNSLFTAQMPVASSAKITGSYEMTEVIGSNLFNRRVVGGEFLIANKYLIEDFEDLGIWSEEFKNDIIMNEGSIQNINFNKYISVSADSKKYDKMVSRIEHLMDKYKTIWEVSQKELINMAADRAPFIDQSQSMNIYFQNPSIQKLSSSHFHAWKLGLKSLCYYVRTKAISTGAKHLAISINNENSSTTKDKPKEPIMTETNNKPEDSQFDCFGCSS